MSLLGGVASGAAESNHLPHADDFDLEEKGQPGGGGGISKATLVVIIIGLVAIGVLYTMGLMQGELGAADDTQVEARMEQILAKLSNPEALDADDPLRPDNFEALFQDTDSIVASLNTDITLRQVAPEFVKKNPFKLPFTTEPDTDQSDADNAERQRQAELSRLRGELGRLNLQSVMSSGGEPVAIVDGEMYRPGETLGSFQILSISASNQRMMLEAADEMFTLSMDD